MAGSSSQNYYKVFDMRFAWGRGGRKERREKGESEREERGGANCDALWDVFYVSSTSAGNIPNNM